MKISPDLTEQTFINFQSPYGTVLYGKHTALHLCKFGQLFSGLVSNVLNMASEAFDVLVFKFGGVRLTRLRKKKSNSDTAECKCDGQINVLHFYSPASANEIDVDTITI